MMSKRTNSIGLIFFLTAISPLMAHPGHSVAEEGIAHWLISPDHAGLVILMLLVATLTFGYFNFSSLRRRIKSYISVSSRS